MNFHNITKCDMLNGDGVRVVLWVSGCRCGCRGCQNKQTWDFDSGIKFGFRAKRELLKALKPKYIRGITFSGGHPLEPENIKTIMKICKKVKRKFPTKDIWVYTGYVFEDIKHLPIMKYIDVLVDGPYMCNHKDLELKYRGSSNQRTIDVQESLKQNQVVLKHR